MGYDLISSGVKGEFKFSTKFGGVKADLASISPGLLFVLLGTLLIGFALFVEKEATYYKQSAPVVEKPKTIIPPKVELPSQDIKDGKSDEEKK